MVTRTDEATIDAAVLEEVRGLALGAGPGIFTGLLFDYLADSRHRLRELRAALSASDAERARKIAHSLRGSSASVGARRLAWLAEGIEEEAGVGCTAGFAVLLETADEEFGRVRAALEPLMKTEA